jgi:hypothetical protein
MRDSNGRFLKGHAHGLGGRPEQPGHMMVKDMCWQSINRVATALFNMPEPEFKVWFEMHKHELSTAERMYLEAAPLNLAVVEALLDRIIGKQLRVDDGRTERNPIIERLYHLKQGQVRKEIEDLRTNEQVIDAEFNAIEIAKSERADKP